MNQATPFINIDSQYRITLRDGCIQAPKEDIPRLHDGKNYELAKSIVQYAGCILILTIKLSFFSNES